MLFVLFVFALMFALLPMSVALIIFAPDAYD